jgi:hypothetical protein
MCFNETCHGQIETDSTIFLKNIGKEILEGRQISTIDEKYLYQIMDSIFVKDSINRSFYFAVFRRIRNEAKGYVAENVDFLSKEFCRRYPNEFFKLPKHELKEYAYDIGEIFRTEEEYPERAVK